MNFGRLAAAAVAAWIAFAVIGYLVNVLLLADLYREHMALHVMRPAGESNGLVAIGLALSLLGFFAFAYAYAKGYEGGAGAQEGLRFGVLVALMLIGFGVVWQYVVFAISSQLLAVWVVDALAEFAIYGAIVGTIYRPAAPPP